MKQGEHEWCKTCDGEGRVDVTAATVTITCPDCGGFGCIRKEQVKSDKAAAVKLQATLDEVSRRINRRYTQ